MKSPHSIFICALALIVAFIVPTAMSQAGDAAILLEEAARASNESFLWGPYRPGLFFGVRPRIYKSLMGSLMWSKVDQYVDVRDSKWFIIENLPSNEDTTADQVTDLLPDFRLKCQQNAGFDGYGWDEYDVRQGGVQTIHDVNNFVDITINFVKIPGGKHGGSWGARIKFQPRPDAPPNHKLFALWLTTLEGDGNLKVHNTSDDDKLGLKGDVVLQGNSQELGDYTLTVTGGYGKHPVHDHQSYQNKPLDRAFVYSGSTPEHKLWDGQSIVLEGMQAEIEHTKNVYGIEDMPPPYQIYTVPHTPGGGNFHAIQKVFEGSFEFDVIFSSGSAVEPVDSITLTKEMKRTSSAFKKRFNEVFTMEAPFNVAKYKPFAESMFSNLFGGLGYFAGEHLVDRQHDPAFDEEDEGFDLAAAEAITTHASKLTWSGPNELFTTVPSRPFFPRGFMWDEGFHLIPIASFDMDATLEVIKSWYALIDEDGWIAREQILGAEAQDRVPIEFRVQYPHYANPPTLFLMVEQFVDRLTEVSNGTSAIFSDSSLLQDAHLISPELAKSFLDTIYPLLVRHYEWFRRTQRGKISEVDREAYSSKEGYRWRGRTATHILTSGLDDYPRAPKPDPAELHVDLISWVGLMSRSLKRIATYLDLQDDVQEFTRHEYAIVRNIDDLHWSSQHETFCDSTIDDFEESVHVCHKGYVSIMPFATGHLPPDSPRMGAVLSLIGNKDELWSNFGIRSLSKSDPAYGTGEDYWRGAVWMNLNYMTLQQLLKVAQSQSEHAKYAKDLYNRLRINLVDNVYNVWDKTGFAFEQYNDMTGAGQRTQHFTGWTALVVKIMTMPDLRADRHDEL